MKALNLFVLLTLFSTSVLAQAERKLPSHRQPTQEQRDQWAASLMERRCGSYDRIIERFENKVLIYEQELLDANCQLVDVGGYEEVNSCSRYESAIASYSRMIETFEKIKTRTGCYN